MEDPNIPFIEGPDEHEKPEASGLFCFIDSARPCSSECMAYLVVRPEGKDYEGQQFSKCMLLVNVHKAGKHIVALAGQGADVLKHLRVKRADEARANQPMPPPVK